jgi:hypothetical protein
MGTRAKTKFSSCPRASQPLSLDAKSPVSGAFKEEEEEEEEADDGTRTHDLLHGKQTL